MYRMSSLVIGLVVLVLLLSHAGSPAPQAAAHGRPLPAAPGGGQPVYLPVALAAGSAPLPTPSPTPPPLPTPTVAPTPTSIVGGGGGGTPVTFFLPFRQQGSIDNTRLPQVRVDCAGGLHVVYSARYPDASGRKPAYYIYCPVNCTTPASFSAPVSLGDLMVSAQLELDPQDHPRVLLDWWTLQDGLAHYDYATCDGGCTDPNAWSVTPITTGQFSTFPTAVERVQFFALDGQGRPRFLYYANPFGVTKGGMYYDACDNSCSDVANWTETQLTTRDATEWDNPALALAQDGTARVTFIVYDQASQPNLEYAECSGDCTQAGNWATTALLITTVSGVTRDANFALRVDPGNHVRLALYVGSGTGGSLPPNRFYYLACDTSCGQTSSWSYLDVGFPNGYGESGVDLTFDAQSRPRVAVRAPVPVDELTYAQCDTACETVAGNWSGKLVPSTQQADAEFPIPLAQGCPSPECIPPIAACTFAAWDAGYWPSIALDPAGKPAIAYDILHWQGGACPAGSDARFSRLAAFN